MKPKKRTEMIHPCKCISYNGGQCYNCLNGAHDICEAKGGCKTKVKNIGLPIKVINSKPKKRKVCEWTITEQLCTWFAKTSCGKKYQGFSKPDIQLPCPFCGSKIKEVG